MEIHQKKAGPDYHRLKTMVKRSIEQDLRNRNFEARNGNYETSVVVKNPRVKQCEQRSPGDCWQWKANGQCVKGDNCSFRPRYEEACKDDTAAPFSRIFYAAECEKCIANQKSQRQKPKWENGSTAVQGLPQRNLHNAIPCKMASSGVLVLQSE